MSTSDSVSQHSPEFDLSIGQSKKGSSFSEEKLPYSLDDDPEVAYQKFESFWAKMVEESNEETGASTTTSIKTSTEMLGEIEAEETDDIAEAEAGNAEEQLPEPTFEQRYEKLMEVVNNKPSHTEILRKILIYCEERRDFTRVEEKIQTYSEYPNTGQNPYRLIKYLIDGEGLSLLELDEDENILADEKKEGLTEDEIDDLILSYALETTEVGKAVKDNFAPKRRLNYIFEFFNDRQSIFSDLLQFCREPRSFKEIETLLSGKNLSSIKTLHPESGIAIKPTVFVDNMEKAGGIVWKDGWVITKEGEEFLKEFLKKTAS